MRMSCRDCCKAQQSFFYFFLMFLRGHLWVSYQGIFFSSFPTYKNQTFTNPDPDEPVSDASLLQDKPQPVMFAPQGKDEHRGIFLVNLHSPLNSGTAGINAKYNELVSWFTAGCRRIRTDRGALHFLHILLLLPQSYHRRFSPPRHGAVRYLGHAHDIAVQPHPQGDVLGPAQYRHASDVRRLDLARSLSNPTYAESRAASVIERTF